MEIVLFCEPDKRSKEKKKKPFPFFWYGIGGMFGFVIPYKITTPSFSRVSEILILILILIFSHWSEYGGIGVCVHIPRKIGVWVVCHTPPPNIRACSHLSKLLIGDAEVLIVRILNINLYYTSQLIWFWFKVIVSLHLQKVKQTKEHPLYVL